MDMNDNKPIRTKSRAFAIRIINLYKHLRFTKQEFVISKQLLRSGTSIGANVAESESAISKKDFLSKIYIALKECNETIYWLDILHATDYINDKEFQSVNDDCIELKKMLTATTKTTAAQLIKQGSDSPQSQL